MLFRIKQLKNIPLITKKFFCVITSIFDLNIISTYPENIIQKIWKLQVRIYCTGHSVIHNGYIPFHITGTFHSICIGTFHSLSLLYDLDWGTVYKIYSRIPFSPGIKFFPGIHCITFYMHFQDLWLPFLSIMLNMSNQFYSVWIF
jgi:hypothetical protein